ncbi:hypothetical protein [Bacillus marinisedimentorum]|uniref:hypothetical protein n=1 Tax=Bacillus marinisedimentorum TaxID=1821260 RepID=UPI0007DF2786|nr:hypothetical protein [Bacillus marinisedimentorum]
MKINNIKKVVKKNWDELGIAAALADFLSSGPADVDADQAYVLDALKRSNSDLADANNEELHAYVSSLDEEQLVGLVNNVKGIAHEVYYVEMENEDGDTVEAYMFESTNHPDYDVSLYDSETGETTDIQLKATDSEFYVQTAVDEVGADQVYVTEELAGKMGLQSTGISNEELTRDVEEVVDNLMEDHSLWNYVPALSAWSIALIIASLTKRYQQGEITRKQYLRMLGVFGGAKVIKIGVIIGLLSIPIVNVATGAVLVMKMMKSVRDVYAV